MYARFIFILSKKLSQNSYAMTYQSNYFYSIEHKFKPFMLENASIGEEEINVLKSIILNFALMSKKI